MENRYRLRKEIRRAVEEGVDQLPNRIMGVLDEYHVEPRPLCVRDRNAEEFEADFGRATFDLKIDAGDEGTIFVVTRGDIFLVWHFDKEGQFIDYVERSQIPLEGFEKEFRWLAMVYVEMMRGV